ncbi:hypothetical protein CLG96_06575 [Sphingomonas oleivorans]|uniref:Uncharacterized protein n=1 Tax=Sphingomonas oleivorans TaxID=1735121 RepID=A0A2T5FZT3_9SPHN|nr:hypothetical protein CLG96_06575 [Sphingomonas oleivorans]
MIEFDHLVDKGDEMVLEHRGGTGIKIRYRSIVILISLRFEQGETVINLHVAQATRRSTR